nr:hypothetical protein [Mucilaginibacter sp. L294]
MKKIIKSLDVSYDLFKHLITGTSHFISARGVRYNIISVDGKEITFERAGAGKRFNWTFSLNALYAAYTTIQNFENTRAFK